jgi:hypothetical protein
VSFRVFSEKKIHREQKGENRYVVEKTAYQNKKPPSIGRDGSNQTL